MMDIFALKKRSFRGNAFLNAFFKFEISMLLRPYVSSPLEKGRAIAGDGMRCRRMLSSSPKHANVC